MRFFIVFLLASASQAVLAQGLTLDDALARAKAGNGLIVSSNVQAQIARSQLNQSVAAFWPVVTPQYRYVDQQQKFSGGFNGTGHLSYNQISIQSSWLILDAGKRGYAVARSRNLADAASLGATDTLRLTLFTTTQQFFDAMRAQELLKVADAQVDRARQTVDVTKKQVELGATPAKDILQADADLANALVSQLAARNAVSTARAALKATIGWTSAEAFPDLVAPQGPMPPSSAANLESAVSQGMQKRPDLQEARKRLQAERYDILTAERDASFDWTLNVDFTKIFEPSDSDNRNLTFLLSYPLFDAGVARESVRQSKLALLSNSALLKQQEHDARSEIESAFLTWQEDQQRLEASEKALAASLENFKAASESQAAGVASVIEVTAAQVLLVTAETNHVEALYDSYISTARLKLVIGDPLPGETP